MHTSSTHLVIAVRHVGPSADSNAILPTWLILQPRSKPDRCATIDIYQPRRSRTVRMRSAETSATHRPASGKDVGAEDPPAIGRTPIGKSGEPPAKIERDTRRRSGRPGLGNDRTDWWWPNQRCIAVSREEYHSEATTAPCPPSRMLLDKWIIRLTR
jgi:hypothetical protein